MWCSLVNAKMIFKLRQTQYKKQKVIITNKNNDYNVLQWNARGLSQSKMTELRKMAIEHEVDTIIIVEAHISEENMKYYNISGFNSYALYKNRQIANAIK